MKRTKINKKKPGLTQILKDFVLIATRRLCSGVCLIQFVLITSSKVFTVGGCSKNRKCQQYNVKAETFIVGLTTNVRYLN